MFKGFHRPRSNFYRLPNNWFDVWATIRRGGRAHIIGLLKVTEYVVKWTWGYGNFADPVRISLGDFQHGRRVGDRRLDRGIGLARPTLVAAVTHAVQAGLLERTPGNNPAYLPRLLASSDDDPPGFDGEEKFNGFPQPQANYFVVPAIWTDLMREASSEVTILAVEYLFRHTWGWRGGWDEPVWMTEEEIAAGRRYEQKAERYDNGIGYSVRSVHDGLVEAVRRGWVVWRRGQRKEYALHLEGMIVSPEGEFLGWQDGRKVVPREAPDIRTDDRDTAIAHLREQIQALLEMVSGVLESVKKAGIDVGEVTFVQAREEPKPVYEEVEPVYEELEPVYEELEPPHGRTLTTSYTDTLSDTCKQTPAADTGGECAAGKLAGADLPDLPDDLRQRLAAIGFRGRKPMQELLAAFRKNPERIRWWIEHLADAGMSNPAGFLLQVVVREEAPIPALSSSSDDGKCRFCGGTGHVTAVLPEGKQRIPCPACSTS